MSLKITTAQFVPLTNLLLIQRDKAEERTENGIIIPEASKVPALTGRIVSAGPECKLTPTTRVLYGKYAGTNLDIQNESYLLMPEKEVLAVILPAPTDTSITGGVDA